MKIMTSTTECLTCKGAFDYWIMTELVLGRMTLGVLHSPTPRGAHVGGATLHGSIWRIFNHSLTWSVSGIVTIPLVCTCTSIWGPMKVDLSLSPERRVRRLSTCCPTVNSCGMRLALAAISRLSMHCWRMPCSVMISAMYWLDKSDNLTWATLVVS